MKKINTMKIEGKRWFQRSYGNTYHTVKIYVNDEVLKSEITYGRCEEKKRPLIVETPVFGSP